MLLWLATLAYQDLVLLSNSADMVELATILATGISPQPLIKAMRADSLSIQHTTWQLWKKGLSKAGKRQEWGSCPLEYRLA